MQLDTVSNRTNIDKAVEAVVIDNGNLPILNMPKTRICIISTLIASVCTVPVGYMYAVVNIPQQEVQEFINETLKDLNDGVEMRSGVTFGIWTGVILCGLLGIILGAMIGSFINDRLGRRLSCLMIGSSVLLIGCVCMAASQPAESIDLLMIGRFVAAIASGITYATSNVYVIELCTTADHRNLAGSIMYAGVAFGIFLAHLTADIFVTNSTWNYVFGAPIVLAITAMFMSFFVPDSPIWQLKIRKNLKEVRKSLSWMYGYDAASDIVNDKLKQLQTEIERQSMSIKPKHVSFSDIFTNSVYRKSLIISCLVNIQSTVGCGGPMVFALSTKMLIMVGMSAAKAKLFSMLTGLAAMIFSVVGLWLVPAVGHRILMLSASVFAFCIHILFIIFAYLSFNVNHIWPPYLCAICLIVIILTFFVSVGPLSFLIPAKLTSNVERAKITGIAMVARQFGYIICQFVFIYLWQYYGLWTYFIFPSTNIVCNALIWWLVPRDDSHHI